MPLHDPRERERKQTLRMLIRDKHCWCTLLLAPFFHWWSILLINGIFWNLPEAFRFPVLTCVRLSVFFLESNSRQVTLWEEGSEEMLWVKCSICVLDSVTQVWNGATGTADCSSSPAGGPWIPLQWVPLT